MKLAWSKRDESKPSNARDVKRHGGQLLGGLDDVLPCLYVARCGTSARDLRARTPDTARGLFAVTNRRARPCWRFPL